MKANMIPIVLALLLMPVVALGQVGYYDWSVSFTNTSMYDNTGADLAGVGTVYLWVECCNIDGSVANPGMSAAEMRLHGFDSWSVLAFTANTGAGFLNAGGATDLALAVGGCPVGPVVAGDILVSGAAGGVWIGSTDNVPGAATVDCGPGFSAWEFPQWVRYHGCRSAGGTGPLQDFGSGCSGTTVETSSWGTIKAIYR